MADEPPGPPSRARSSWRRRSQQLKVSDLLVHSLSTISSLAYHRLAQDHRDLEQARLAIESLRALVPVLRGSVPDDLVRDFEQVTANLQLAYAERRRRSARSANPPRTASRSRSSGRSSPAHARFRARTRLRCEWVGRQSKLTERGDGKWGNDEEKSGRQRRVGRVSLAAARGGRSDVRVAAPESHRRRRDRRRRRGGACARARTRLRRRLRRAGVRPASAGRRSSHERHSPEHELRRRCCRHDRDRPDAPGGRCGSEREWMRLGDAAEQLEASRTIPAAKAQSSSRTPAGSAPSSAAEQPVTWKGTRPGASFLRGCWTAEPGRHGRSL